MLLKKFSMQDLCDNNEDCWRPMVAQAMNWSP